MKIMGLVCLTCSDAFLSAESLWQKWLEFLNMFEMPWNIICGSTCYFPKYDLMMMLRVMITAVIVQVTMSILLFLLLHHFCTASYFFACLQHNFLHIFSYILFPPLHWNFWWCPHGLIYPQVHSHFFLYCLGQISSSFSSGVMPMKSSYINRLVQLKKKQSPYHFSALIYLFFHNVFLSTYLYLQFPLLFLCTSFYNPGFFTFSSHHCGLSDLDSCAETGDFGLLL